MMNKFSVLQERRMSDGLEKTKRLSWRSYTEPRRHRMMTRYVSNDTGRNYGMRRFPGGRELQVAVSTIRR